MYKNLAARVRNRQRYIDKLVDFVEELTREHGRITRREVHSSNTTIERELKNVAGFSFYYGSGFSMYGGGEIQIYYQPRDSQESDLVFHIEWSEGLKAEEVRVKHFRPDYKWQRAIRRLMNNKDKIIVARNSSRQAEDKRLMEKADREARKDDVAKKAERLGLI
jgi:hypothetical protein